MIDDSALARFWSKVDKRGPDECWPWTGSKFRGGRGSLWVEGRNLGAPRISLFLAKGAAPSDKPLACHTCDNPNCVNPNHLWWGSYSDNAVDATVKGRQRWCRLTHCPHGHAYEGENAMRFRDGRLRCRTCSRASNVFHGHRARDRRRAAARAEREANK